MSLLHEKLTSKIIEAYYNVYNELGYGFLEKIYENAMIVELEEMGFTAVSQKPIEVFYKGKNIGNYFADIIVEDEITLELKAVKELTDEHHAQLGNYLKATRLEVGLLLNFGMKPTIKRKIFHNHLK